MGWPVPTYAHVPLILGPDGKKLSKREGAPGVHAYRDELGYLPEGLKNYLLRLGWSHGDDEIISEKQAVDWFDLDGLNKAPARLDMKKLDFVNAHYMAQADDQRLFDLLMARPEVQNLSADVRTRIRVAIGVLKPRAANLVALAEQARFLTDLRPITLSGKSAALVDAGARSRLGDILGRLESLDEWTEPAIKDALAQYSAHSGVGSGKIAPVLRATLTGGAPAPDIALVLALLGRNESVARLKDYARAGS
jgi:glutamyl-tRNA synthetase